MKRRRLLIVITGGLAAVCLLPKSEFTFEFDGVNLRLRECFRYRSWLFGFVLWERCGSPTDHPTAARLRELGVLPPMVEADSRWLLIKGFTSEVRGWKGAGSYFVRALGATTYGAPVTLPAAEDLSGNVWVRWAEKDRAAAIHFWAETRAIAVGEQGGRRAAQYLLAAGELLEECKCEVPGAEVEAHARQAAER
jgi:hypothetical protein